METEGTEEEAAEMALDKRPGVRPVRIGGALHQALEKLVMRSAGYQVKMACGNLHLCASLEAVIKGATHAVGQIRLERARHRSSAEEARRLNEEEYEDEATG